LPALPLLLLWGCLANTHSRTTQHTHTHIIFIPFHDFLFLSSFSLNFSGHSFIHCKDYPLSYELLRAFPYHQHRRRRRRHFAKQNKIPLWTAHNSFSAAHKARPLSSFLRGEISSYFR
jgi:hypothetical protein